MKRKLVIVGYDSGKRRKDAIRDGSMVGAITQSPVGITYKTAEAAVKALKGEKLPKVIDTGFYWYYKSNISDPKIAAVRAIDDDKVICNEIIRGEFRLHPKGPLGISEGCITIEHPGDWMFVRSFLKRSQQFPVPGSALKAYGRVTVR